MTDACIDPDREMYRAAMAAGEGLGSIVMLNLLRFREQAAYPPALGQPPCSGREAYRRYALGAMPFIQGVGGEVLWAGRGVAPVIAPPDEHWDSVFLVRYPGAAAFREMLGNPGYQQQTVHRRAALADSRLIMLEPARFPPPG